MTVSYAPRPAFSHDPPASEWAHANQERLALIEEEQALDAAIDAHRRCQDAQAEVIGISASLKVDARAEGDADEELALRRQCYHLEKELIQSRIDSKAWEKERESQALQLLKTWVESDECALSKADCQILRVALDAQSKLEASIARYETRTSELTHLASDAEEAFVKTIRKGHEVHSQLAQAEETFTNLKRDVMTPATKQELATLQTRHDDASRRRHVVRNVILGLLVESGLDWSDEKSLAGKLYMRAIDETSFACPRLFSLEDMDLDTLHA